MDESRPVATPMAMKVHKRKPDEEACDPTIFQSMIGTLLYVMIATRPDIAYAIRVLSRYNHDPSNKRKISLKRFFRYLNGRRTGFCVSDEQSEKVHSKEKEKAHIDVMSIWTMLDARMTLNR
jgi:hypothetical protein